MQIQNKNYPIVAAAGLLLLATLSWLGITLSQPDVLKQSFTHYSYYIMLTLLIAWVGSLLYHWQQSQFCIKQYVANQKTSLLAILLICIAVFASMETELRIFSDETNLLAISKSLAYFGTTFNSTQGTWYYDAYHPVTEVFPKRPLVFPTLVSIVHSLTGYRVENVFAVNFAALFALLFLLFQITAKRFGTIAGYTAIALVLSQPIVSIVANSGAFDLLSTLFALITALAFARYVDKPSHSALLFLLLTFLVFANIRYESILYGGLMLVSLLVFKQLRWQDVKAVFFAIGAVILFMLPSVWQRILSQGKYENPSDRGILSLEALAEHGSAFLNAQIDFSGLLPYSPILFWLAVTTLLVWLVYLLKTKQVRIANLDSKWVTLAVALTINLLIFLAHHNGYYDRPTSTRFFIIFSIACALLPVSLFKLLKPEHQQPMLAGAVLLFLAHHPIAMHDELTKRLTSGRIVQSIHDFVALQPDKRFLMVSSHPGRHTVLDIGSVNFGYVQKRIGNIKRSLESGLYREVFVAQRMNQKDHKPINSDKLTGLKLEPVVKNKYKATLYLQISRVVLE